MESVTTVSAGTKPNLAVGLVNNYVQQNCDVPKQSWNDLVESYLVITSEMEKTFEANVEVIKKITAMGQDDPKLTFIVKQFSEDVERLYDEVNEIFLKHKDKAGVVTQEEYHTYISIGDNYRIFGERCLSTMMSSNMTIMEEFNRVQFKVIEKLKAQDTSAQDVNVITDVESKEPKTESTAEQGNIENV